MQEDKKNTNNTTKIIIFIVIIIFALGFLFYIDYKQKKAAPIKTNDAVSTQDSQEIENLIQGNENAVAEARKEALISVRPIDGSDYIKGNLDAPAQIIVYNDFDCPFCADFSDTINRVLENFKDEVVVAYRYYPMRTHANSLGAALAAECAAEQGKFWEMRGKLFAASKAGSLGIEQYKSDAGELGLDTDKFNECLDTEKYKDKIQLELKEGESFGIIGTPGNFINGIPAPGAVPFADYQDSRGETQPGMKSLVERELNNI